MKVSKPLAAFAANVFCEKIAEACGLEPGQVQRIVIDANANEPNPLTVYVWLVGDERLLNLDWAALGPLQANESSYRAVVDVTGFGGGKDYDGEGTA